jgi:hypothetical protein
MGKLSIAHIVIIFILLNISAGVIQVAVVDINGDPIFDNTASGGYAFADDDYIGEFSDLMEEEIQPSGSIDDASDQVARVLDMMSLGFISKFINTIKTYMYGFTGMLDGIVGDMLGDDARTVLLGDLGVLNIIFTIAYILFGIQLFTGRNVLEGT